MSFVLSGLSLNEIEKITEELKASKFRAKQIHNWIYTKSVSSIDEMTDLAKDFRETLKTKYSVTETKVKVKQVSSDGTIKYLIEYPDGECVETVLMRFDNRANLTACVSSQVGCAVNCSFCATGKRGFIRNLTYKEIIEQVLTIQRDTGLKVTNIVFMGQGEPLLNLDNVLKALNMMPIENKYGIDKLKQALLAYIGKTGRRITIEYIMIKEFNDTVKCAKELAEYLREIKCNINLIPYNSVNDTKYKKSSNSDIMNFKYILEHSGKKVTVRLERGADIDAACGQLRGKLEN